jgi:3-phenylpropionate/cinnamic acid dioxygenase small subunit
MSAATVEQRLARLEAAEEIRQLLLEYARCLDAGDYRGYAALFTEDGELHAQLGEAKGRAAIQALLDKRLDTGDAPRRTAVHFVGSPTINVDGETATSEVVWTYVTNDADGYPVMFQLGRYRDELVLEEGRWRFKRRTITRELGYSPMDERPDPKR